MDIAIAPQTMNVLTQLKVKASPDLFPFEVTPIFLTTQEATYLPALFAEILDMSIQTVTPLNHVGQVMIFDVTPYKSYDPRLIYCRAVDLKWYYSLWKRTTRGETTSREGLDYLLNLFDENLRALKVSALNQAEAAFLVLELFRYKNESLRRMNTFGGW